MSKVADYFYDFKGVDGKMWTITVLDENDLPVEREEIVIEEDGGTTFFMVGNCVTQEMVDTVKFLVCTTTI